MRKKAVTREEHNNLQTMGKMETLKDGQRQCTSLSCLAWASG